MATLTLDAVRTHVAHEANGVRYVPRPPSGVDILTSTSVERTGTDEITVRLTDIATLAAAVTCVLTTDLEAVALLESLEEAN